MIFFSLFVATGTRTDVLLAKSLQLSQFNLLVSLNVKCKCHGAAIYCFILRNVLEICGCN